VQSPSNSLPKGIFRRIQHLITLVISHNLFIRNSTEYPESALRDLSELQVLYISGINGQRLEKGLNHYGHHYLMKSLSVPYFDLSVHLKLTKGVIFLWRNDAAL
jgi:hypothetical protein